MPRKYLSYKVWYTWNNLASTDHLILYFMNYLTIQTNLGSKHQNWHIFNWYCIVHVSYQKWKKKVSPEITTQKVCNIMFLCLKSKILFVCSDAPLVETQCLELEACFQINTQHTRWTVRNSEIDHTKNLLLMTSHKL